MTDYCLLATTRSTTETFYSVKTLAENINNYFNGRFPGFDSSQNNFHVTSKLHYSLHNVDSYTWDVTTERISNTLSVSI